MQKVDHAIKDGTSLTEKEGLLEAALDNVLNLVYSDLFSKHSAGVIKKQKPNVSYGMIDVIKAMSDFAGLKRPPREGDMIETPSFEMGSRRRMHHRCYSDY